MKKNSFKRFLAVTLAAATALTFAPVSTLGLTGVVEAQTTQLLMLLLRLQRTTYQQQILQHLIFQMELVLLQMALLDITQC